MGAKGSVEAAKINAQNWNNIEVSFGNFCNFFDESQRVGIHSGGWPR